MRDVTAVINGYFEVWNEADPATRRSLIGQIWAEDARYVDPLLAAESAAGIDAMVAGVQKQLPGHRFRLAGAVDSHHDRVRFAWELIGPNGGAPVYAGVDFGTLAADGRLSSVTGFLDRAPAPQQD
jgi:SnoaL-like domain